jgi:hypothetical protein
MVETHLKRFRVREKREEAEREWERRSGREIWQER